MIICKFLFNILFQERYTQAAETNFSKFGLYLKEKILTVPEHILLPEDATHASSSTDGSDLKVAREKFDLLCARAKEGKLQRAALQVNRDGLQEVLQRQERALKKMRTLREKAKVQDAVDRETELLEKKLREELRPLAEKVENNLTQTRDFPMNRADKRKLEGQEAVVKKRFRTEEEEENVE